MPRIPMSCVVGILALGASAAAQNVRYVRQQSAPSPVVLSDRVRPIQPRPNQGGPYPAFDAAIPILVDLLDHHRDHETAEPAANLLLDSLIQLQRYDEVLVFVDQLAADPKLVDGKYQLRRNIELLRSRSLRAR